jgi:hypothetical protein
MCLLQRRRPPPKEASLDRRDTAATKRPWCLRDRSRFLHLALVASVWQSGAWQGDAESIDESA